MLNIEKITNDLRSAGCAVKIFTPEDLKGVNPTKMEEALTEAFDDAYEALKGPDEVECANCSWTGREDECNEPKHLTERMAPGDTYPAGECPECGALAFLIEEA